LEKGKTITGDYYASLLDQLKNKIEEKQPHLNRKKNPLSSGQCPCSHMFTING
jgi:hypothetical protein